MVIVIFPKGGTHYTDLPFRVPSSHAALTLAFRASPFKLDCSLANQVLFLVPFGKKQ
jgi:hypothetical protein